MSTITGLFGSSGGGGLKPKFQIFSASGTFTPSAGLLAAGGNITVKLWGGGGGGSQAYQYFSNGLGGTAGNYKEIPLNISSAQTVTIGAGGAGGVWSISNPSNGGDSTFGSLLTAEGGGAGIIENVNDFKKAFPNGGIIPYAIYGSSPSVKGGPGSSAFGIGLGGTSNTTSITAGGIASGGGGGAAYGMPSYNGAAGGNGYCIVEWWE